MPLEDQKIKDLLLSQNYVSKEDMETAEKTAASQGVSLTDALLSEGVLTKNLLGQAVAEQFGVPFVDIERQKIDDGVFFMIPELVAKKQGVAALARLKDGVKVAMADPGNQELLHLLEKRFDGPVIPSFAFPDDIAEAHQRYAADISKAFTEVIGKLKADGAEMRDEVITETVDLLLKYGYENRASDMHIEPARKDVIVRFRIDGVLHDVLTIEKTLFDPVLSRVKILSKMRTDEHRAAQDGKMRFSTGADELVDVRVSVMPTNRGENVVMRLLAKTREFQLSALGMSNGDLEKVRGAIKHPHGMILATGPTGSGKTTTLYAILKILNRREVNIATVEDPIEYDVEGITQIQVNPQTNLTFAHGLRSIIRQDPNIIMVGEIRDEETAGIAVNAALTGHLLLSTLHTNDAATALPRLLDMKVEPFLVSSTVNVIAAQRLVRKICTTCRVSFAPDKEEQKAMSADPKIAAAFKKSGVKNVSDVRLYRGPGCKVCAHTGYTGRIGIFEVLEVSDEIRELIMRNANSDDIKEKAREQGMTTMMEDGVLKVLNGVTSLEEVLRVARD